MRFTHEQLQAFKNERGSYGELAEEIERLREELATIRTHLYREVVDPVIAGNATMRTALYWILDHADAYTVGDAIRNCARAALDAAKEKS
jgi:hypothetical protein